MEGDWFQSEPHRRPPSALNKLSILPALKRERQTDEQGGT